MLLLNFYTNILLNLIIRNYFYDHRCLLIFTENENVDYSDDIPTIRIKIQNDSINFQLIFHYFGCQGIIIYSKNPAAIFQKFEAQIRLNMERFNRRRFLIVPEDFPQDVNNNFFQLKELEFVSDLLVISLTDHNDAIFELTTHKFVGTEGNNDPVFLDYWFSQNRSFLLGSNLYPDKLSNQYGRPLKMAAFPYEPYSIIGDSVETYQGSELRSGTEFGLKFNMTPIAVVNDRDYWGEIFANWSGNGLLGNLVMDKADIGFSALYTWEICYHYLDLSKPLVRTGITCLVPAPKPAARWITPLFSYTPELWLYVIAAFAVSVLILSLILFIYNRTNIPKRKFKTPKATFLVLLESSLKTVVKPVLLQPLAKSEIPYELASKLMMALILILSLFLTSTYSSGLATVMTLPRYENAINTVEDFVASELHWGATQDAWITSIQNAKEPNYVKIVSKFHPISEEELQELSYTGKFAFSIERLPFENFAIGEYIGEDVIGNFHLMQEDLYWEQCVMMLRKNSVLLPALDLFILKIFEAGLISKWQSKAVELYMNANVQRVVKYYRHHMNREVVKLKWSHVEGAFAVLALGYCLSFIIFMMEIMLKK